MVKAALVVLALLSAIVASPLVGQGDDEYTRKTLVGLPSVFVFVGLIRGEVQRDGLDTIQLRTDVELKLRDAGIPVTGKRSSKVDAAFAYVFVNINVFKDATAGVYAFSVRVELHQLVRVVRDPSATLLTATWTSAALVGTTRQASLRSSIRIT